jgi:hypothetical protein
VGCKAQTAAIAGVIARIFRAANRSNSQMRVDGVGRYALLGETFDKTNAPSCSAWVTSAFASQARLILATPARSRRSPV